jgi:two-component system, OmpR family, sensor histidine kinase KdpD
MNASLYVIFVEIPDRFPTKAQSLHIETCEKLCQEFGSSYLWMRIAEVSKTIALALTRSGSCKL